MLAIRLSPVGKKGQKYFRVIVSEKTKDVFGDYIELLGSYNPHPSSPEVNLKVDRIKHWLSQGAQASPTVHNLLIDQKIIEDKKVTSWKPKKKSQEGEESTNEKSAEIKPTEAVKEKPGAPKPEAKPEEKPASKPVDTKSEKKEDKSEPAK